VLTSLVTTLANAQQVVVVEPAPPPSAVGRTPLDPRALAFDPPEQGPRVRGGISVDGGGAFGSHFTLGLVTVSGRLGLQINDLVGVYAMPYAWFGSGSTTPYGDGSAWAGVGGDAVVDFTLQDRFFLGAGAGGSWSNALTVYGSGGNGLAGPEILARVGVYPLVRRAARGSARRGLMVGVDVRPRFLTELGEAVGVNTTVFELMGTIGYEVF
jgi:hypothetical protein